MRIFNSLSLQVMRYKELEKIILNTESFPDENTINIDKRQQVQDFINKTFSVNMLEECALVYIVLCMNNKLKANLSTVLDKIKQFVRLNVINSIEKLKERDIIEQRGPVLEFKQ